MLQYPQVPYFVLVIMVARIYKSEFHLQFSRESYKSIKETMMTRPELDAFKRPVQDMNPKGFGYTEFVLVEELIEQNFVQNNQLLIKVLAQPV